MIDKTEKTYIRYRNGKETYIEKFDDVEKAADPQSKGEFVEVKVNNIKFDFTRVKEENGREPNGRDQERPAKDEGLTKKESELYVRHLQRANKLKVESYNLHLKVADLTDKLMRA